MTRLIAGLLLVAIGLTILPPAGSAAPPPALRMGVREDSFGVAHITTPGLLPDPKRVRQAVEMGAAWDRFPVYFSEVQETKGGPFKWDRYDATVNANLAAGINSQGILLGYPKWGPHGDWLKDWEVFVREAATRYKGKIKVWEVWNEPDLKADNGEGVFWKGSPADYYDLLKVSYRTLKSVDPTITVLLGGLSFTWNNQDWFPRFLDVLAKDPTAKENNYYFDALALHQYGRPSTLFDLPIGYVGKPSFDGFHGLMAQKGFAKPIWANEVGVPIWNVGTGQNGPGRATADEAANFIWQAFAYGFAAGIERIFIFQLYDDGASSIDPATKQPADYFGLVSNSGDIRPAYRAYQTAVDYLTGAKLVTRVNLGRKYKMGAKGWDAITFWGTQEGKVTIAWSNIGQPAEIFIPASTQRAKLMDKFGKSREITASNGGYLLKLPAATNNNNFGCISGECAPEDFIIGGEVQILVEDDKSVPAVAITPIGPGSLAPFTISWSPIGGSGSGWTYDVQVKEDGGEWRDWIVGSPQTSAVYGERPDFPAQFEKTYQFRVRAKDRDGKVIGMGYPPNPLASTTVLGGKVSTGPTPAPAPAPIVFHPTASEFAAYYSKYDGPRLLGRAISPAFAPGGVGGKVQYFEKGRLEDHSATQSDPAWKFQYGLLVDELQQAGATQPIGGDTSTLTYKSIADLSTADKRVPPPAGHTGNVAERPDGSVFIPFSTDLRSAPGHTVPAYFWKYITRSDLFPGGWLHDVGLPITEPVEATVSKGSITGRKIVVQAFQRAILTYDPANPADWQVERANVGTDYRRWFPSRVPSN
ncbi:MAG: hypothetical protein KatS3mg060_1807 [Dehalococcoidia bacterium]|nr:MAG: hypothetical protein KatS3mg060_1807 [Dehalococcoidia bacterium]